MPRRSCTRHEGAGPCTCAMGHMYRFVEPVVLLMLRDKGRSYGYDLVADLARYALTDGRIESAALYRTLRELEVNGFVSSAWKVADSGPARRVYSLTPDGLQHLHEWAQLLQKLAGAMSVFARKAFSTGGQECIEPGRLFSD